MAVYALLAAILIIDGIRTLFNRENIFYHSDSRKIKLPAGFLLISAGGAVMMMGLQLVYRAVRAKGMMWIFIIIAAVMMVLLAVKQQR